MLDTPDKTAVVLLSGGMDSTVAAFWAAHSMSYNNLRLIFFDYGQKAVIQEIRSAAAVGRVLGQWYPELAIDHFIHRTDIFGYSNSSLLQREVPVGQYKTVEEAIAKTDQDKSYIPIRNAIFLSIAGSILLTCSLHGGDIVTGIRSRPDGPGGFPDCTHDFASRMSSALSQGSGANIEVMDVLNRLAPSRAKTIKLAQLLPGCFAALKHTYSCFDGAIEDSIPCGNCLPCLRRAQAFAEVGVADPALGG
jgi:7-cyano-7-deazaguanine synthase